MQAQLAVDTSDQQVATTPASEVAAATYQAFRVGSVWCYTGFDEATELVDPLETTWLPNTPTWFKGLAHLNGYVVPVVDWASDVGAQNPNGNPQKPLFHLLFGRQQQRIAIGVHTLPFTVTTASLPQPLVPSDAHALPIVLANTVDAVLPWNQMRHTAQGSSALGSGDELPQVLHHLSGVLLAEWFSRSVGA